VLILKPLLKPLNRPQQESNKTKKGGAIGTAFCLCMGFYSLGFAWNANAIIATINKMHFAGYA